MENPAGRATGEVLGGSDCESVSSENSYSAPQDQRRPLAEARRARKGQPGEGEDDYVNVVARLSDRWRVIRCSAGIQWVLQRRDAGNAPSTGWRGVSYCVTRESLLRRCGGLESPIDPSAMVVLDRLPACIREALP